MQTLNLPPIEARFQQIDGKDCIFDIVRKKFIILTPEEWVRQHFLHLLIDKYEYPRSLFKVETGHNYNQLQKRSDIVVYNREGKPFLLIECKAPEIKITQASFEQAALYNQTLRAEYLVVSNGMQTLCCRIDHEQGKFEYQKDLPRL